MQKLLCFWLTVLYLVCADNCPDGQACKEGNTCCKGLSNSFDCCPFHQAVCCEDHIHCCPEQTLCLVNESRCVNATASLLWEETVSTKSFELSKSFRMIKSFSGEDNDTVCPDVSHCPAEFSCLKALRGYGCCPLVQGVSCDDGKHCCPEDHQCSADGSSCIKLKAPVQTVVTAVRCSDRESECPDGTTCCETQGGTWGCCPMPKAVCCGDKIHCCPEGSTCDITQLKCISTSTYEETPMWAKSPARKRADWENQKAVQVTTPVFPASYAELPKVTTAKTDHFAANQSITVPPITCAGGNDVPCDDTSACADKTTCCKTKEGKWACCPLPKAVCCEDFIHCCPTGSKCNLVTQTCDTPSNATPWLEKVPARLWNSSTLGDVPCDSSHRSPDQTTCCKTASGEWACCPLPQAVCCEDHAHCCPKGTTCDLASLSCKSSSGSLPMVGKVSALTTWSPDYTEASTQPQDSTTTPITELQSTKVFNEKEEGRIECDAQTTCPKHTTCCFMQSSKKWGCCPLPKAVCCSDGNHCCPFNYKCDTKTSSCSKNEVVIPWYTKLSAESTENVPSPNAVDCDGQSSCPEGSTCCQLATGKWGCCPLKEAVCCQDKEHCCPQGYRCDMGSGSCQRLIFLQLQTVPLTRVSEPQPKLHGSVGKDIKCDSIYSCNDDETCCKTSNTAWGCCPSPNAVCCSDRIHCCPTGHTCTEGGHCTQDTGLNWDYWQVYFSNKKRALTV